MTMSTTGGLTYLGRFIEYHYSFWFIVVYYLVHTLRLWFKVKGYSTGKDTKGRC